MTAPAAGFRIATRDTDVNGAQVFMSDRWTISTGSAMPNNPTTKLTSDLISDYWAARNHRSSNIWIQAASDNLTQARNLGAAALLGFNRRVPTAVTGVNYTSNTIRMRADKYPLADRIR